MEVALDKPIHRIAIISDLAETCAAVCLKKRLAFLSDCNSNIFMNKKGFPIVTINQNRLLLVVNKAYTVSNVNKLLRL